MIFDPDIHHRQSIRLPNHDYSSIGAYFVTICARDRECLFAEIVGATLAVAQLTFAQLTEPVLKLSDVGNIVEDNWLQIPQGYPQAQLDEYVIMPNHFHGIIMIDGTEERATAKRRATARVAPTLGDVIGGFKSRCVVDYLKHIRKNQLDRTAKIWQRNYYEHVIRDDDELERARAYIQNNPFRWAEDKDNPINIRTGCSHG